MKFISFVLIWGSVAIYFGGFSTWAQESRASVCTKDVSNTTYKDVFEKIQPTTSDGECLLECMLRISSLLLGNGLVNTTKIEEYLNRPTTASAYTEFDIHTMIKAVRNCKEHKALSENKCETAALFLQCTAKEVAIEGASQYMMSGVIHSAIFSYLSVS